MFERNKEMNLEVIRDEFSTFIDNKECKMSQIKVEIPFGNTPNKKMKFSISHSHLNDGDYCWAINNCIIISLIKTGIWIVAQKLQDICLVTK